MSVSYWCNFIVGYKFDLSVFDKSEPQCNHTIPANAKFCPICGKKVEMIVEREDMYEELDGHSDGDYEVVIVYNDDDDIAFVGYVARFDPGEWEQIKAPPDDIIKAKCHELMANFPVALKDKNYGTWGYFYVG